MWLEFSKQSTTEEREREEGERGRGKERERKEERREKPLQEFPQDFLCTKLYMHRVKLHDQGKKIMTSEL